MALARRSATDPPSEVTGIPGPGQSPIEPVVVLTGCLAAHKVTTWQWCHQSCLTAPPRNPGGVQ